MDKGDAFIMLASAYHGGGTNSTKDQHRLVYATFAIRGFLRQEENQFLTVPREVAEKLDQPIQAFMGYSMSGEFSLRIIMNPWNVRMVANECRPRMWLC